MELLWRLARAVYEQHKRLGSDADKLTRLQQGEAIVQRAMQLDEKHPNCHKWMAIYLNAITKLQGSRAQIEQGQVIKGHMLVSGRAPALFRFFTVKKSFAGDLSLIKCGRWREGNENVK